MMKSFFSYFFSVISTFLYNSLITYIPCNLLRIIYLKLCRVKIGKRTWIDMRVRLEGFDNISIGDYCHINSESFIRAIAPIKIGNCVSISYGVKVFAASHDINSPDFVGDHKPIVIEDYCWLGLNSVILGGAKIGKGAVVAAGAVVTKDVPTCNIAGGIPAKIIGTRQCQEFTYKPLIENKGYKFIRLK